MSKRILEKKNENNINKKQKKSINDSVKNLNNLKEKIILVENNQFENDEIRNLKDELTKNCIIRLEGDKNWTDISDEVVIVLKEYYDYQLTQLKLNIIGLIIKDMENVEIFNIKNAFCVKCKKFNILDINSDCDMHEHIDINIPIFDGKIPETLNIIEKFLTNFKEKENQINVNKK